MITIKELSIDTESAEKIIDLIKKHEPEIWKVLKMELKQAFSLNVVVKPFFCNNEKMGVRCTTQCLGCDGFERNE